MPLRDTDAHWACAIPKKPEPKQLPLQFSKQLPKQLPRQLSITDGGGRRIGGRGRGGRCEYGML